MPDSTHGPSNPDFKFKYKVFMSWYTSYKKKYSLKRFVIVHALISVCSFVSLLFLVGETRDSILSTTEIYQLVALSVMYVLFFISNKIYEAFPCMSYTTFVWYMKLALQKCCLQSNCDKATCHAPLMDANASRSALKILKSMYSMTLILPVYILRLIVAICCILCYATLFDAIGQVVAHVTQ